MTSSPHFPPSNHVYHPDEAVLRRPNEHIETLSLRVCLKFSGSDWANLAEHRAAPSVSVGVRRRQHSNELRTKFARLSCKWPGAADFRSRGALPRTVGRHSGDTFDHPAVAFRHKAIVQVCRICIDGGAIFRRESEDAQAIMVCGVTCIASICASCI